MFSLLRQGLSLEREFGTQSLSALISLADLVENSVYELGSLAPIPGGLAFRLHNPPLRAGAFSSLRLVVNGLPVPAARARLRPAEDQPWRTFDDISSERPLSLRPGDRSEFAADVPIAVGAKECTIRLEFQSVAIPPLVWIEFTDQLRRRKLA